MTRIVEAMESANRGAEGEKGPQSDQTRLQRNSIRAAMVHIAGKEGPQCIPMMPHAVGKGHMVRQL